MDWPTPVTAEDRELRRVAKLAVLTEAHKLHRTQRENQALNIGQVIAATFGQGG